MSSWGTKQNKRPVSCFSEWSHSDLKYMHKLRHYSQLTVNLTFSTTNQRLCIVWKSTLKHIRRRGTDADVYLDFSAENDAIKLKLRWKSVAPCFVFLFVKYSEVSEMYINVLYVCNMHNAYFPLLEMKSHNLSRLNSSPQLHQYRKRLKRRLLTSLTV